MPTPTSLKFGHGSGTPKGWPSARSRAQVDAVQNLRNIADEAEACSKLSSTTKIAIAQCRALSGFKARSSVNASAQWKKNKHVRTNKHNKGNNGEE